MTSAELHIWMAQPDKEPGVKAAQPWLTVFNWVMLDDTRGGCSGLTIFDIRPSRKEKNFLADTLPSIFKIWREFLLLFNWDGGGSMFSLDPTSKQMISVAENKEPCLGLFWSYPLSKINSHGSISLHSRPQCHFPCRFIPKIRNARLQSAESNCLFLGDSGTSTPLQTVLLAHTVKSERQ